MVRRAFLIVSLAAMAGCARPVPTEGLKNSVIFFTADSAALDTAAQASIRQVADTAAEKPTATVRVRGFSAPDAGSAAFNKALSETRARAVADALTNAGVAASRIRIESRGAVAYDLIPTESRRVEIAVGP